MLTTIKFDNQAYLATNKIRDERSKRHLPHKFVAIEMTASQFPPKPVFSLGLVNPQLSGASGCPDLSLGRIRRRRPLTRPPLRSGHPLPVGERRAPVG